MLDRFVSEKYDKNASTPEVAYQHRHDLNGNITKIEAVNGSAYRVAAEYTYDTFALRYYNNAALTSCVTFHYVLNAQGDVVQLNYQGETVYAGYSYDA